MIDPFVFVLFVALFAIVVYAIIFAIERHLGVEAD